MPYLLIRRPQRPHGHPGVNVRIRQDVPPGLVRAHELLQLDDEALLNSRSIPVWSLAAAVALAYRLQLLVVNIKYLGDPFTRTVIIPQRDVAIRICVKPLNNQLLQLEHMP